MNLTNIRPELWGIIIIIFIYWYFNIKNQGILTTTIPLEKMSNISIFDGNNL